MEEQNITIKQLNEEDMEFIRESLKGIRASTYEGIINGHAAMREIVNVIEKYDLSFNQAQRLLTDTADFLGGCKMKIKKKTVSDNQKQFENGEITLNEYRKKRGLSPITEGDEKLQLIDKE